MTYGDQIVGDGTPGGGGGGGVDSLYKLNDVYGNFTTERVKTATGADVSDGQALVWNSGLSKWVAGTVQSSGGTVTSVGLSMPTGFSVSSSPVTSSGTLAVSFASGYSLPTTAKQTNWDTAYGWGNHANAGYLLASTASSTYQPIISDLSDIRSGASAGATAYQLPPTGIPKTDLASAVQDSLNLADSALQSHQTVTLASGTNDGTLKITTAAGTTDNIAVTGFATVAGNAANGNTALSYFNTGVLPYNHGGTGLSSYTKGDLLYASANDTLAKLAANSTATKKFLTMTSSVPSWDGIAFGDLPTLYWANVAVSSSSSTTTEPTVKSITIGGATLTWVAPVGTTPGYLTINSALLTDGDQIVGGGTPGGGGGGGGASYLYELKDFQSGQSKATTTGTMLMYQATGITDVNGNTGAWKYASPSDVATAIGLGNYLPLTGGSLTLNSISGFEVRRTDAQNAFILFQGLQNNENTLFGWLGFQGQNNPTYRDANGNYYTLYHTGNFVAGTNYVSISGAETITGAKTFTGGITSSGISISATNPTLIFRNSSGYFGRLYMSAANGSFYRINSDWSAQYTMYDSGNLTKSVLAGLLDASGGYYLPLAGGYIQTSSTANKLRLVTTSTNSEIQAMTSAGAAGNMLLCGPGETTGGELYFRFSNIYAWYGSAYYGMYHSGNLTKSVLTGLLDASGGYYLPLAGGTMTGAGSITFAGGYTTVPVIRNYTSNITNGWARGIVALQVDGVSKFSIGAYGSYTAGGSSNGITYAYIGCNSWDGVNLRITDSTITWGTNNILHAGNYASYALPLSAGSSYPLTGDLYITAGKGIQATGGAGLLVYHPATDTWTGLSNTQWGVGATDSQGVIRSNNNNLLHYRNGTTYDIWDKYNAGTFTTAWTCSELSVAYNSYIHLLDSGNASDLGYIRWFNGTDGSTVRLASNGIFQFYTGSTLANRLTINASGNVGIGTASPASKLHVSGTLTTDGSVTIYESTSHAYRWNINFSGTTGRLYAINEAGTAYNDILINNTITVTSGYNVGIGTPSPSYKLDVAGTIGLSDGSLIMLGKGTNAIYLTQTSINWHNTSNTWASSLIGFESANIKIQQTTTHSGGHIYLTGANASSSTANTTQIVFGTSSSNHVVISSNTDAVIINPTTSTTTGQIVLGVNSATSSFGNSVTFKGADNRFESATWNNVKIKRTSSGGAWICFYPNNQETNYWDIGANGTNPPNFAFEYQGNGIKASLTPSGKFSSITLQTTSTSAEAHLMFGRGGANYVTAPSGGGVYFVMDGKTVSGANSTLQVLGTYCHINGYIETTGDQVISSDATLKKNWREVGYGIEDIAKCTAGRFDWIDGHGTSVGSKAQDWLPLVPELVHGEEGNMTLAYGQIALVNTILLAKHETEQDKEIRELKERVRDLEKQLKMRS